MKAIIVESFGPPGVLKMRELPKPEPSAGEVLIQVRASGICHHDVMHRAGKLPGAKTGVVIGHETAGDVVGVGAGVSPDLIGTKVVVYQRSFCGHCRDCLRGRQDLCRSSSQPSVDTDGGNAEFVTVPRGSAIPVPPEMDYTTAALACCPIATGVRALMTVAKIEPGDRVLITGASGGLGAHQLQLVHAFGGTSIAVTTSPAKVAFLKSLGADDVVVAEDGSFGANVWMKTGKRGVDIAIDNVGNQLAETLRCVTHGGRAVVLGNILNVEAPVSPGLLIGRRLTVSGSGMGTPEDVRHALAMMANGQVKPVISSVMPFDQVSRAHELIEARAAEGRIVLQGW